MDICLHLYGWVPATILLVTALALKSVRTEIVVYGSAQPALPNDTICSCELGEDWAHANGLIFGPLLGNDIIGISFAVAAMIGIARRVSLGITLHE